jgi:tripartite-type tricarboxylate transporter receptor subunit TctC
MKFYVAAVLHSALLLIAPMQTVRAQDFPVRPLRMVIAFPPGGAIDLIARTLSQKLGEGLGQAVVLENRPGGNTLIAGEAVARAPADGYTLFMTLDTTLTHLPALYDKLPFDSIRDFSPVSQIAVGFAGFIGHARDPFRNLPELIAFARANPGKLNFGAGGPSTQTAVIELGRAANINIVMVPYKGTGPLLQAIAAGDIHVVSDGLAAYMPGIKQGNLRALVTTSPRRNAQLPDVHTIREEGYPQLEYNPWFGLFAPSGTPRPVIARLNAETGKALAAADLRERLQSSGFVPVASTPEQLGALLKEDLAAWTVRIKSAGVKLDQ